LLGFLHRDNGEELCCSPNSVTGFNAQLWRVKHQHLSDPSNLVGFSRCGGVNKAKLLATNTIVNNAKPNRKFAAMNLIAFSKGFIFFITF